MSKSAFIFHREKNLKKSHFGSDTSLSVFKVFKSSPGPRSSSSSLLSSWKTTVSWFGLNGLFGSAVLDVGVSENAHFDRVSIVNHADKKSLCEMRKDESFESTRVNVEARVTLLARPIEKKDLQADR